MDLWWYVDDNIFERWFYQRPYGLQAECLFMNLPPRWKTRTDSTLAVNPKSMHNQGEFVKQEWTMSEKIKMQICIVLFLIHKTSAAKSGRCNMANNTPLCYNLTGDAAILPIHQQ